MHCQHCNHILLLCLQPDIQELWDWEEGTCPYYARNRSTNESEINPAKLTIIEDIKEVIALMKAEKVGEIEYDDRKMGIHIRVNRNYKGE